MKQKTEWGTLGALALLAGLALIGPVYAGPLDAGNSEYKAGEYAQAVVSFQQTVSRTQGTEQAKAYYQLGNAYHKPAPKSAGTRCLPARLTA